MASVATSASATGICAGVMAGIMVELAAGRLPWAQPWDGAAAPGLPRDAITGERWTGPDALILWEALAVQGYGTHRWLTFAQARELGGHVRRGAEGVALLRPIAATGDGAGELPLGDEGGRGHAMRFRRVTVFNIEQCAALPLGFLRDPLEYRRSVRPWLRAELLMAATGADVRIGDHAAYDPAADIVLMPEPRAGADPVDWYRLLIRQLARWTGHRDRLDRGGMARKEEGREGLVAEIAEAFVCAELGIVPSDKASDGGCDWGLGDARSIFDAARAAGEAADWLLRCLDVRCDARQAAA